MPSREAIVIEARQWIGTKWRHQGRQASGIDCCGLVIRVGQDLGLTTFDIKTYGRRTSGEAFIHYFKQAGLIEIPISDTRPGDILITQDSVFPCHCGFIAEKNGVKSFIHAYATRKKVVEDWFQTWEHKATTAFRFPGIE